METSDYIEQETDYAIPACGLTREGYSFEGWNTQEDGGGTAYADQATLVMVGDNATLFAQWRPIRFGSVLGVATSYVYSGEPQQPKPTVTGPEGQALKEGTDYRMECIKIKLYGELAKEYNVYYRVHVQGLGWMACARNGAKAGTTGESRRVEALQVVLVKKGAKAPAANYKGARQTFSRSFHAS